jgi:hypothetical protein
MGTRHLITAFDEQGDLKIAQYGQWDGYPEGQGVDVLAWLRMTTRINYDGKLLSPILNGMKRTKFATDEELENLYSKYPEMNFVGTEDEKYFSLHYPNLTRDTGADILGVVAYSVGDVLLVDSSDFAEDELMCEGIYSVNFQSEYFTSNHHGTVVAFPLRELPTNQEYLEAFATAYAERQKVGA